MSRAVGQLFDVGVDVGDLHSGRDLVRAGAGGVFLSGRSQVGRAVAPAIAQLQAMALTAGITPLHISADEEGGDVQSVRGPGIPEWPSARDQATWSLPDLVRRSAAWASSLAQLGLTLDLAPVADVVAAGTENSNPAIGVSRRSYGTTPPEVSARVQVIVAALQAARVAATVKHFPGLGRVTTNTDTSTSTVDGVTTATDPSLQPFASSIHQGVLAVMVSSATYPRIDPGHPAVFSRPVVNDLLRARLHFSGLILSDDLSSARAVSNTPVGQRAVTFLHAGGDMVLIVASQDFRPMVAAVTAAALSSPAMAARVRDAALHVLRSKATVGLLGCP